MSKHPLYNHSGLIRDNKPHVLYALVNKQMRLKEIEIEYKAKIEKIKKDLTAIEHTICLFDSNCLETINSSNNRTKGYKPNGYFKRGEARELILARLKESDVALKSSSIALDIQKEKNISTNNKDINRKIAKIINDCLRQLYSNKLVDKTITNESIVAHWVTIDSLSH